MTEKRGKSSEIAATRLLTEKDHLFGRADDCGNIGRHKIDMQNGLGKNHKDVEDEEQIDHSAEKKQSRIRHACQDNGSQYSRQECIDERSNGGVSEEDGIRRRQNDGRDKGYE